MLKEVTPLDKAFRARIESIRRVRNPLDLHRALDYDFASLSVEALREIGSYLTDGGIAVSGEPLTLKEVEAYIKDIEVFPFFAMIGIHSRLDIEIRKAMMLEPSLNPFAFHYEIKPEQLVQIMKERQYVSEDNLVDALRRIFSSSEAYEDIIEEFECALIDYGTPNIVNLVIENSRDAKRIEMAFAKSTRLGGDPLPSVFLNDNLKEETLIKYWKELISFNPFILTTSQRVELNEAIAALKDSNPEFLKLRDETRQDLLNIISEDYYSAQAAIECLIRLNRVNLEETLKSLLALRNNKDDSLITSDRRLRLVIVDSLKSESELFSSKIAFMLIEDENMRPELGKLINKMPPGAVTRLLSYNMEEYNRKSLENVYRLVAIPSYPVGVCNEAFKSILGLSESSSVILETISLNEMKTIMAELLKEEGEDSEELLNSEMPRKYLEKMLIVLAANRNRKKGQAKSQNFNLSELLTVLEAGEEEQVRFIKESAHEDVLALVSIGAASPGLTSFILEECDEDVASAFLAANEQLDLEALKDYLTLFADGDANTSQLITYEILRRVYQTPNIVNEWEHLLVDVVRVCAIPALILTMFEVRNKSIVSETMMRLIHHEEYADDVLEAIKWNWIAYEDDIATALMLQLNDLALSEESLNKTAINLLTRKEYQWIEVIFSEFVSNIDGNESSVLGHKIPIMAGVKNFMHYGFNMNQNKYDLLKLLKHPNRSRPMINNITMLADHHTDPEIIEALIESWETCNPSVSEETYKYFADTMSEDEMRASALEILFKYGQISLERYLKESGLSLEDLDSHKLSSAFETLKSEKMKEDVFELLKSRKFKFSDNSRNSIYRDSSLSFYIREKMIAEHGHKVELLTDKEIGTVSGLEP